MACREGEGVKEAEAKDLVVPGSKGVAWLGKIRLLAKDITHFATWQDYI